MKDVYGYNEYGKIDIDNELTLTMPNYTSTSDFRIELHYINNVLYYKVLPKNLFIDKYKKYDGYFLDENMKSNLSKKFYRGYCIIHYTINNL